MALATTCVSLTLTRASLFESFRSWTVGAMPSPVAKLFHCPYCISHWIAPIFTWLGPQPSLITWWVDPLAVIGLAAVIQSAMTQYLFDGQKEIDRLIDTLQAVKRELET